MKTLIAVFGVIGIIAAVLIGSYVSNYNYGNEAENQIITQHKSMENVLAQYSLKVSEAAQVPGMYKDDLKDVMTSVMTARQGEGGSKAAFQWFKEHEVNISPEMYTKIQQIIESGRNKFTNTQDKFFDQVRTYKTKRGYLWTGFWLKTAGYPTVEYIQKDYDNFIVSSDHAQESFKTGIDKGIKLR